MAKPIMIQGTMSNAGKSLFAAALCRILKQDGYKVAPFKSQNMALNSFITKDGFEMGRAQVMQAEAAGVIPDVAMNPILLKPTTDVGSQVIVNGKVVGNMKASEYFRYKKELIPKIQSAYEKLDKEYDIIVIEGAGSPAELNLKQDDIVNMGLAKMVNAPVILVGDIDRGGVFAQLIGTVKLLEEDEQQRIKGLVVNKFRGERRLFDEGVKILEEKSGKKVVGVVPYMKVDIEEEDSLSEKLDNQKADRIDIAVIRLPRISNYTDFDVFRQYEGVSVRYVSHTGQLGNPDMIIIPGTKSTISDCRWLRENGLEASVKKCASNDIPVFGICGGYQILGEIIEDKENCESEGSVNNSSKSVKQNKKQSPNGAKEKGNSIVGNIDDVSTNRIKGMGLLPIRTVFEKEKKQTQVKGTFNKLDGIFAELEGMTIDGYEIHMGRSTSYKEAMISLSENHIDGCNVANVYGTYIHGIFDNGEISELIVRKLYEKKGYPFGGKVISRESYKEMQYERLANIVRKNIDMEYVYSIIGGENY